MKLAAGLAALMIACPALAQEKAAGGPSGGPDGKGDTTVLRQIGGGVSAGSFQGHTQASLTLQSNNGQIGNGPDGIYGDGQVYSFGKANLDLGIAGIEGGFDLRVGKNFIPRGNNQTFLPLLGLEPLNFAMALSQGFDSQGSVFHRELGHQNFFEYTPMLSAGVQLFTDTCKAMAAVRGGAAIGSLATSADELVAVGGAYGVGVSGICNDLLMFDANLTRIHSGSTSVDEASLMAALKFPGSRWSVGVDLDGRMAKDNAHASPVYSLPTSLGPSTEFRGKAVVGLIF